MKSKMIATATCESLKRKLDARVFQCNDADDMGVDVVKERIEKFSANRQNKEPFCGREENGTNKYTSV